MQRIPLGNQRAQQCRFTHPFGLERQVRRIEWQPVLPELRCLKTETRQDTTGIRP